MTYSKRLDGRKKEELRKITAEVGVVKNADGSAMFQIGNTRAIAAVYGPRELHPRFMQNPKKGVLRCNYNMMPFSGMGNRVRPGNNRRSTEISMVTTQALNPVLDLSHYPTAGIDVFIELDQTDAGSRCAGICAASMALADAGLPMKDLVCAVAVGSIGGTVVADLSYDEEAYDKETVADIPLAIIPSTGEITLLQMDGEIKPDTLTEGIKLGKKVAKEILKAQSNALKKKYE